MRSGSQLPLSFARRGGGEEEGEEGLPRVGAAGGALACNDPRPSVESAGWCIRYAVLVGLGMQKFGGKLLAKESISIPLAWHISKPHRSKFAPLSAECLPLLHNKMQMHLISFIKY